MTRRSLLSLVTAIAVLAVLLHGAQPTGARAQAGSLEVTSVVADGWPALQVTTTVLDAQGQPVPGLAPAAFSARIGDQPAPLTGLNTTSDPGLGIAVVLTFDVSGSMVGAPMEQAKAAGLALLQQLGPEDQVAVVSFSDAVTVVQPFTPDKGVAATAVNSLAAVGNTALYAAVSQSVQIANQAPLPRRAVVLLSDGRDIGGVSNVDAATSVQQVTDSGVLLFPIGLGGDLDQDYLNRLATAGRSQLRIAPAPGDLGALYQGAASVLTQQYVLTIDASAVDVSQVNDGPVHIEATVGGQTLAGEAPISLPAGVVPPPPTPAPATAPPVDEPVDAPVANVPVEEPGSSSSFPVAPVLFAALLGIGGLAVLFVITRRRRAVAVPEGLELDSDRFVQASAPIEYPTIVRAAGETPRAWLISGENRFPLTSEPVTLGFTDDCTICIPNGTGSHADRARVWLRDGSYMLHNLSRIGGVTIAGKPVTWAVLEDGDEIIIGGSTLVFRDSDPAAASG